MKIFYSILCVLSAIQINAQEMDCPSKIREYQTFYKSLKINEAYTVWSETLKRCPKNEIIYTDGIQILQYKIDNAAPGPEKEKWVRDLLKLYDLYNKNFPLTTADFEINKAMALHNNRINAENEIYTLLELGFSKGLKTIKDANAAYLYFSMCHKKHLTDKNKFTTDFIFDKYLLTDSVLAQSQTAYPEKKEEYKTARTAIAVLLKQIATCESLTGYFEKNFEANKDNADWLFTALTSMSEECSNSPVFFKLSQQLYSLQVTAESANFLALASLKQRHFEDAVRYFNETAELQNNPAEKAKIYYSLATGLLANEPVKSRENLKKALAFDPKMGKAYLFLAQLYSNDAETCGKDAFEKKAVYYLSIQTAANAGKVEPRLKPAADQMIAEYTKKSLTKKDIKKKKMKGKSMTIGCWINETINFPAK